MSSPATLLPGDIPSVRVRACHAAPPDMAGRFVLYWMHAYRRVGWNFALQRAVQWARTLGKPLLVLETLPCGGRWASERHHQFVLEGMADNQRDLLGTVARYYPFVEQKAGQIDDLLAALAAHACVLVTDDFPIRSAAEAVDRVARRVAVSMEQVDSAGMLPMRAVDRAFTTAHALRRTLQRILPEHLLDVPKANPLARSGLSRLRNLPRKVTQRWPPVPPGVLQRLAVELAPLPIDHSVGPVRLRGGSRAARSRVKQFVAKKLPSYVEARNQPEQDATSGLSPYLHFGHVSAQEVFWAVAKAEDWSPGKLAGRFSGTGKGVSGSREGWWGMSAAAEAFLDELITWREVGWNICAWQADYDRYESLPTWAKQTLADHRADARPYVYDLEEFENARTHDRLWNAAQRQLLVEGRIHNYLRMLWGKKILHWSAGPEEALETMIQLNNKWAVDGEDPNSYSGIFWVLGRYDRAWGPQRPVFGKVRYMSSSNTARKVRVVDYVAKYAGEAIGD